MNNFPSKTCYTRNMILDKYSPEEYAAFWGSDPVYCKAPLLPNDGYLFYNFGSENQERTLEWLLSFFDAIGRMMEAIEIHKEERGQTPIENTEDMQGLGELRYYVQCLIQELHAESKPAPPPPVIDRLCKVYEWSNSHREYFPR